jgi:hypothetical protein
MRISKALLALVLLAHCMIITSCDNTVKLAAPWKDIPVVYAIFDGSQAIQYVRVEKAFLDPENSATTVAQIPDSLYYPESAISVYLRNSRTNTRVKMERFDGDTQGLPRKSGVFAQTPNWLYRANTSDLGGIIKGDALKVEVERNDPLPLVEASTNIPDAFDIQAPEQQAAKINFFPSKENGFRWGSDANAFLFNIDVYFMSRTIDAQNMLIKKDTVRWRAATNVERGTSTSANLFVSNASVPSIGMYNALGDSLDPVQAGQFRLFDGVFIKIKGGGKEIKDFLVSSNAAAGVSGAEFIPIYTNVTNGLGLVTAINETTSIRYNIQQETKDSIMIHPITKNLGFIN